MFERFLDLQNRFRSSDRRALDEDSVSKLKKERSASVCRDATGRILGSGKGDPVRGLNFCDLPDNVSKNNGWRIYILKTWSQVGTRLKYKNLYYICGLNSFRTFTDIVASSQLAYH